MTAASLLKQTARSGVQPVDISRHLGDLAHLMEVCFSAEMDASGRALVREMRFLSHFGPLLSVLGPLGLDQQAWGLGQVWVESGRVVGSVSTRRAAPRSTAWLIANVAVLPEYRRRGIGLAMMQASLDFIRRQRGRQVLLQVDDDHFGATELYRRLGFARVTTQTAWVRPARTSAPAHLPAPFDLRLRAPHEWADQFALAQTVRPAGLAWNKPLRPEDFRSPWWQRLDRFFSGQIEEHWVVEAERRLAGSLTLRADWSENARLILLVHPDFRGQLERPLLARGLRRLAASPWSVRIEHPAGEEPAETALREFGFQPTRTLLWMRLDLG